MIVEFTFKLKFALCMRLESNVDFLLLQIPEEEKNLGPHDRLIHVYHLMKDTTQNQVVSSYG